MTKLSSENKENMSKLEFKVKDGETYYNLDEDGEYAGRIVKGTNGEWKIISLDDFLSVYKAQLRALETLTFIILEKNKSLAEYHEKVSIPIFAHYLRELAGSEEEAKSIEKDLEEDTEKYIMRQAFKLFSGGFGK